MNLQPVPPATAGGLARKPNAMKTRILLVPVLVLSALAVFAVDEARAAPINPATAHTPIHFGPRIFVGGGVRVPITTHRGYHREVVETVGGYFEIRTEEVEVPGEQIGWDMQGRPLYGPARIEARTYRVWVPARQIVRRVYVPGREIGHVTIGGRIRLR